MTKMKMKMKIKIKSSLENNVNQQSKTIKIALNPTITPFDD